MATDDAENTDNAETGTADTGLTLEGDQDLSLPIPPDRKKGRPKGAKGKKWQYQQDNDTTPDEYAVNPINIAEAIAKTNPMAWDRAQNLYYWYLGRYVSVHDTNFVHREIMRILTLWGKRNEWDVKLTHQVTQCLLTEAQQLWDIPPGEHQYKINLYNGIYDLNTNQLLPHTPDYLSTIQLPIIYDPKATCPTVDRFLNSVLPEGDELLYQLLGFLTVPCTSMQTCFLLLGKGSNGKGTFLRFVERFLGLSNISHVSLDQLEEEKFSRSSIVGKLANIFGDIPVKGIDNIRFFKALTGEDNVLIEYKNKTPFSYKPFCRLLFSGNKIPKTNDDTEGFKRRWLTIPFMQRFAVTKRGDDLVDDMSTASELSGVLNRVLPTIMHTIEEGFTYSAKVAQLVDRYIPIDDHVDKWFNVMFEADPEGVIEKTWMYRLYALTCAKPDNRTCNESDFITFLKTKYPEVMISKGIEFEVGRGYECYLGVRLSAYGVQTIMIREDVSRGSRFIIEGAIFINGLMIPRDASGKSSGNPI